MADLRLIRRLDQVANRLRLLRGLWTGAIGWAILSAAIFILSSMKMTSLAWSVVLFGVPILFLSVLVAASRRKSDRHAAAVLIEKTFPELDSRLITAVQQQPQGHDWDFSFLQSELLSEVFSQLRSQRWHRAVAASRLWIAQGAHAAALITCLVLLVPMLRHLKHFGHSAAGAEALSINNTAATGWQVLVEPGNVELERNTGLLVLARFPGRVPGNVELVAVDQEHQEIRLPLQKSLDDPLFGGRIAHVPHDLIYHVEFAGECSEEFRVTTFAYPELLKADANVAYPEYTKLPPHKVEDIRRITLVEGSHLELVCQFNKPLDAAELIGEDAASIPLVSDPANNLLKTIDFNLTTPGEQRFKLQLRDAAGRMNRDPTEFHVTVVPNRAPDLKISFPSKDLRVSALQELQVQAQASDDFGLTGLGLIYQTPSGTEETIDFAKSAAATEAVHAEHLLAMEEMQAKPDDLISYYFYADDVGPDGHPRRSFSDLFFAEVRPFEEIFRQQPSSGGGGEGDSAGESGAGKLLELQKQVVTAAWNVIRREQPEQPSEKFSDEASTLEQSQRQIQLVANQMNSELQDALLKQHAEEALQHMQAASTAFHTAAAQNEISAIGTGRTSAQSAYRSLLKLQAREMMIQQASASRGQSGQSSSRLQQQLQSLKLKNDQDRYETERQAQTEQAAAAQAALQVLEKLKELARRQEDLNQRIRELESALRDAPSEAEKQELQRQLQRLQSEQEDLLRNLDEVREQMNQGQNQQQMNEARQQADEARERVMRSSEALKAGQTSRALTEGTRAERQLQQLEDHLRQKTAGQFDQALRELRNDVRELSEKETGLAEKLKESTDRKPQQQRSLRDAPTVPADSLAEDFQKQRDQLQNILERTKNLIEDAETSEPLLSKKLYDTVRKLRQQAPEEALESIVQLTQRGFRNQLEELEQQARTGIENLKSGIEDAADGILGNETEALRQAQSQLSELSQALQQELALNDTDAGPAGTPADRPGNRQPGTAPSGEQPNPSEPETSSSSAADGPMHPGQSSDEQKTSGERPSGEQNATGAGQSQSSQSQSSQSQSPSEEMPTRDTSQQGQNQPGQGQPGQGQPGQGQPGQSQPGQSQPGQSQPGQGQPGQSQPGQSQPGQGQPGQGQPGQSQPGQSQPGQGQPGQSQPGQSQPGQSQPGQSQPGQSQPGQGQPGQSQPGQGQPGQSQPGQSQPGQSQPGQGQPGQSGGGQSGESQIPPLADSLDQRLQQMLGLGGAVNGSGTGPSDGPLSGDSYSDWSNRLQNVEEMLPTSQLRAQAAAIRDRARQERVNIKRHSKQPDWQLVRTSIYGPLIELEAQIAEELARRDPDRKLVPIDRDPVPEQYSEFVKSYYEELSKSGEK